jgi:hypothetical protein
VVRLCLELRPPTALLLIPRIYEYGEPRWNDIVRGQPKNSERNLSQFHFVHHKSLLHWPGPLRWEAGRLSHGTAFTSIENRQHAEYNGPQDEYVVVCLVKNFPMAHAHSSRWGPRRRWQHIQYLNVFVSVVYLTTIFINSDYIASNEYLMINWKRCGRNRSRPNLRYYPGICVEGLRKVTKGLRIAGLQADIWTWDLPNTKQC